MHLRPVAGPPRCKPRTAARRDPRPARRTRGGAAAEMKANPIIDRLARAEFVRFEGRVTAIGSGFVEGDGPLAKLGDYCTIGSGDASRLVLAEVIAVERESVRLMALSDAASIELGTTIVRMPRASQLPVGDAFAGRAIDAMARPIDQGAAIHPDSHIPRGGR